VDGVFSKIIWGTEMGGERVILSTRETVKKEGMTGRLKVTEVQDGPPQGRGGEG